jgi:ferric-dicitrate binding protein FerR (iron transport regulator)
MNENYYINLLEKYLCGEGTPQEKDELQSYLISNNRIDSFFEENLSKAHPVMDKKESKRMFHNICDEIVCKKPKRTIQENSKRILQWAAILILPIISALSVYYFTQNNSDNFHPIMITAQKGEKAEAVLPDGTKVWINSESTIRYDNSFNQKKRIVYLEGEAYFEVASNKKVPFVVQTKSMDVQALGTSFNVRSYGIDSLIYAVLLDGEIKVSASDQEQILNVNQRAIFNKSTNRLTVDAVEAINFIEWKKGNIYFNNQTFSQIAQTLSRIYNVDIEFASEELSLIRFSGTLGSSGIKNALDVLTLTSPMYYDVKDTTVILYHKDNKLNNFK